MVWLIVLCCVMYFLGAYMVRYIMTSGGEGVDWLDWLLITIWPAYVLLVVLTSSVQDLISKYGKK